MLLSDAFSYVFHDEYFDRSENRICLVHSLLVAKAAKLVSERIFGLDSEKAFLFGLMHDVGKLYLPLSEKYKHPLFGYRMFESIDKEVAAICLSHPFPLSSGCPEYIEYYCKGDSIVAETMLRLLKDVKNDLYTKLIQLCDKISGKDAFVKIEDKFRWYKDRYKMSSWFIDSNYEVYCRLKRELDDLAGIDIYSLLFV
jgi:hypothetical protein